MGLPYHTHTFEVPEASQDEVDNRLQVSKFITPDKLSGFVTTATVAAGYQPLDADLTAIAALSPSNDDVLQRKAGVWTNRTIAQLLTDLSISGSYQPLDTDLTAIAALTSAADKVPYSTGAGTWALADFTTAGRNLMDDANAGAQLTTLGLTANGQSLVTAANYAAMRTLLDLEAGTDFLSVSAIAAAYQPLDADLTAIAALTSAADKVPYATGAGTWALADLSAFARTFLDDADLTTLQGTLHYSDYADNTEYQLGQGVQHNLTNKATPVAADEVMLADSAASFAGKRATLTALGNVFATAAQGALANSALQSADIGSSVQAYDADTAKLDIENQALTGGVTVTSKSLGTQTSGTLTLDMGDRPLQHYTNGGAHTLAPGSVVGSCLVDITNDGSAGAITTSGWTMVAGDSFTTTNTNKFRCHCSVGNGGSLLIVQALQ